MLAYNYELTDEEVEHLEKLMVKLYYEKRTDLYQLCSKHAPEMYARFQRKQKIPETTRWVVWRRDGFTCAYCLSDETALTLDHIVPEEQGGDFSVDNLVTACGKCNSRKAAQSVEEFIKTDWLKQRQARNIERIPPGKGLQAQQHLASTIENRGVVHKEQSAALPLTSS